MEWFRQQSPKYKDCIRRILTTSCLECFIDITGWAYDGKFNWQFLSIGSLSSHDALWRDSWKGRLHTAYRALRGRTNHEITFDTREDAYAFIEHVKAVADEVWPEAPRMPENITVKE